MKDYIHIKGQPTIILRDKNGKIKPLWQENAFGKKITAFFKKQLPGSSFALRGVRLPFFGHYVDKMVVENVIVDAGKALMNSRLFTDDDTRFSYLAVGSGSTSPSVDQTALDSEISSGGLSRAMAAYTTGTHTFTNDLGILTNRWDVTSSNTVREVGVFNAPTGGTMLGRRTFPEINVANGDTLELVYKVRIV